MKYLSHKTGVVGIWIAAIAMLVIYLISMRYHVSLPVGFFWVSVSLIIGTIVYQCTRAELSSSYIKIVLFEVAFTCFIFHLIYQIPFHSSYGIDPYIDMVSTKGILVSGFVAGDPQHLNDTAFWPIIHIVGTQISLIADIDLTYIAKWFPSFLGIPLILLLYLMIKGIFKQEKVALLSALLFASLQPYILYSSLFIRETISLVLAICCIFLYLSSTNTSNSNRNIIFRTLAIICLIGTIFAHHLTSFMLLVFFIIHYIIMKVSNVSVIKNRFLSANIIGGKINITLIIFIMVSIFLHWRYYLIDPLRDVVRFATELLTPSQWGLSSFSVMRGISPVYMDTMREILLYYGFYFIMLIFTLMLVVRLLQGNKNARIETYSFTSFLFVSGLFAILFLYLLSEGVFPHRFETFGWLLGFGPLVFTILNYGKRWLRQTGIFLLIAFMLLNFYQLPPRIWDSGAVSTPGAVSAENYALAHTINFSEGTIAAGPYDRAAIYDVHSNLATSYLFSREYTDIAGYDWVIINKDILEVDKRYFHQIRVETVTQMEQIMKGDFIHRNKIYESDNLLVSTLKE